MTRNRTSEQKCLIGCFPNLPASTLRLFCIRNFKLPHSAFRPQRTSALNPQSSDLSTQTYFLLERSAHRGRQAAPQAAALLKQSAHEVAPLKRSAHRGRQAAPQAAALLKQSAHEVALLKRSALSGRQAALLRSSHFRVLHALCEAY